MFREKHIFNGRTVERFLSDHHEEKGGGLEYFEEVQSSEI